MRLATCEVLCETCNRAVANRYCQESCICDGCWDVTAQRSVSQPLGSSVTALPLCERCEQVPVADEVGLCTSCQVELKNGKAPPTMDFTASLWSASPASASTRSVASPRTEPQQPRSMGLELPHQDDAPVLNLKQTTDSVREFSELRSASPMPALETTTRVEVDTTESKGCLPFWFSLLCEDIELRNRWAARSRKRRHTSSVDVCPSETRSSGDVAQQDRPPRRQRLMDQRATLVQGVVPDHESLRDECVKALTPAAAQTGDSHTTGH